MQSERGARPSRSFRSAARRTTRAADSTRRVVRLGDCCLHVGGTPTAAVETTALGICNCSVPYSREHFFRFLKKSLVCLRISYVGQSEPEPLLLPGDSKGRLPIA